MVRIAVRNQVCQQIEDLCLVQRIENSCRHIRGLGQGPASDVWFPDGDRLLIRRQRSNENLLLILALQAASEKLAGFRFDLSRSIALRDDF